MPFLAPHVGNETDALTRFALQQADQLRITAHGLDDGQARSTPTASALSIAGLLVHAAQAVHGWLQAIRSAPLPPDPEEAAASLAALGLPPGWWSGSEVPEGMGLVQILRIYDASLSHLEPTFTSADLDEQVPIPQAPWYPVDAPPWNVRWVAHHLTTELARHAGHADLIRESIDGQTAYVLNEAAAS